MAERAGRGRQMRAESIGCAPRRSWRGVRRAAVLLALACAGATAHATGVGSAEVQINLCSEPREIARRLELTSASAEPVKSSYFDSAGLDLWQQGLLFRLRIKANKSQLTLAGALKRSHVR